MYKVLIVEDEDIIRKGLMFMVNWQQAGCVVAGEAADGLEGLEKIRETRPDIVIVDINMPVMDGLQATRFIRMSEKEDSVSIPIIAMSANAFSEDMKKSMESGMNGHLVKPIEVEKTRKLLEKCIK